MGMWRQPGSTDQTLVSGISLAALVEVLLAAVGVASAAEILLPKVTHFPRVAHTH